MTREEKIICKDFLNDADKTHSCNEYKLLIALLEQELCEDVVSRAKVKKIAKEMYLEVANMKLDVSTISDCISYTSSKCREVFERELQELPKSVTPQESRTGHWIIGKYKDTCNKCRCTYPKNIGFKHFCPNCGSKMFEPLESEE